MNKKAIAVAVSSVLGLPAMAHAETAAVEIYGKLYPQFQVVTTHDASPVGTPVSTLSQPATGVNVIRHNEINANSSRLGFRGSKDLGSGFKAIFQIESQIDLDVGGDILASRNSFVGLEGKFGTVRLGKMDSVYKDLGTPVSLLGVSAGNFISEATLLSRIGFVTNSASRNAASFHRRLPNMVHYETPELFGLQLMTQYSPDEAPTNSPPRDLAVWAHGIKFEKGPVYLALAQEIHKDAFGGSLSAGGALSNAGVANATSNDTAVRFSAGFKFGSTQIGGDIAKLDYKERGGSVGRFENYERTAWDIGVQQKLGKVVTLIASYTKAAEGSCALLGGPVCNTNGLGAKLMTVGAGFTLSKGTTLFTLYSRLENDESARFDNIDLGTPSPGNDSHQFALGISHSF